MSDHHDHSHEHQHAKPMMCGGAGAPQPASEEAQKFLDELRPQIEEKTNAKFEHFKAIQMRTQVVAGLNYFLKVQVHDKDDKYIHVRIFRDLQQHVHLSDVKVDKKEHDSLDYF